VDKDIKVLKKLLGKKRKEAPSLIQRAFPRRRTGAGF